VIETANVKNTQELEGRRISNGQRRRSSNTNQSNCELCECESYCSHAPPATRAGMTTIGEASVKTENLTHSVGKSTANGQSFASGSYIGNSQSNGNSQSIGNGRPIENGQSIVNGQSMGKSFNSRGSEGKSKRQSFGRGQSSSRNHRKSIESNYNSTAYTDRASSASTKRTMVSNRVDASPSAMTTKSNKNWWRPQRMEERSSKRVVERAETTSEPATRTTTTSEPVTRATMSGPSRTTSGGKSSRNRYIVFKDKTGSGADKNSKNEKYLINKIESDVENWRRRGVDDDDDDDDTTEDQSSTTTMEEDERKAPTNNNAERARGLGEGNDNREFPHFENKKNFAGSSKRRDRMKTNWATTGERSARADVAM